MSTLMTERCSVCSAPLLNLQKWPATKTRSTSSKRNTTKQNLNRSNVSKSELSKSLVEHSIEDEYIKQLQQQIYYLESECQYLRGQLNQNSILIDRSNQAEQERSELQRSLVQTSSQYEQLSSENHGLTIALDELRRKFAIEKKSLLDELESLHRSRDALNKEKRLRDQELRQIRDQNRVSSDELKTTHAKIRILEQQFEQQLNQNKILTDEFQHMKLESNNLQRNLNEYQTVGHERDRLQGIVADLEKEIKALRHQLKAQDARYNEAQYLLTKLTDEKAILIKELKRLEALAKEFERESEELRLVLHQHKDALQLKDQELTALRKKEQSFRGAVDSIQMKLETELIKNKDLDGQLKQLQRQLNIEIQNTSNAKREMNDYEALNARLRDEIDLLQHDKDHLISQINTLQKRLTNEESITNNLRIEIQQLEIRVQEIDRLKTLEDLIQSQRWDDITQMAQTMQTVSRTMSKATSPTLIRKKRVELQ